MLKFTYILKEALYLVKRHKIYFLLPILITLAVLTFIVFYIGPSIIISFIYAGI